ncbi:MAG: hypothetical protein IKV97_05600 [Clostridia bacterium]|nr:hypothetical protein [Clostridia bacterium]
MSKESTDTPVFDRNEKIYSAKDLEKKIETRLLRERKSNEATERLRSVLINLREKDQFKSLSNAAVAEILADIAVQRYGAVSAVDEACPPDSAVPSEEGQNEPAAHIEEKDHHAQAEPDAESDGETPYQEPPSQDSLCHEESFAHDGQKKSPVKTGEEASERERKMRDISDFLTVYSEKELLSAFHDDAFRAFCTGKRGSILELYEDYRCFINALENTHEARNYRAARSGLASTAFSGSASGAVDYGSMLTKNQRDIADRAGMSYRRYSELLSQIPNKKLNYTN